MSLIPAPASILPSSISHFTCNSLSLVSPWFHVSLWSLITRERGRERGREISISNRARNRDRIVGKRVKKIQRLVYQLTRDPRVGLSKINGSISFRERCNFFSFFSFLSFALTRAYLLERDDFSGILLINEGRERSSLMIISFRVCSNWNFFFRWHREGGIRTIVEFQRYSYTRSNLNKKGKSYKFNL